MRFLILQLTAIFGLTSVLLAEDLTTLSMTTNEQAEVKQKLVAFEMGKIGLDEASGLPNKCDKIASYYLLHTNDVSVKMKLPISRSFAIIGNYPDAAKLSQEYVNVYSNDWRGWRVLGGANFTMQLYDRAISAYTNAARLGDGEIYPALGAAALAASRLNILKDMVVPRLFVMKADITRFPQKSRLDIIMILVGYSVKAKDQDVFIKALKDVDAEDILSREDLKQLVTIGCAGFKGENIDKIRQKMGIVSEDDSKTNAVSNLSR